VYVLFCFAACLAGLAAVVLPVADIQAANKPHSGLINAIPAEIQRVLHAPASVLLVHGDLTTNLIRLQPALVTVLLQMGCGASALNNLNSTAAPVLWRRVSPPAVRLAALKSLEFVVDAMQLQLALTHQWGPLLFQLITAFPLHVQPLLHPSGSAPASTVTSQRRSDSTLPAQSSRTSRPVRKPSMRADDDDDDDDDDDEGPEDHDLTIEDALSDDPDVVDVGMSAALMTRDLSGAPVKTHTAPSHNGRSGEVEMDPSLLDSAADDECKIITSAIPADLAEVGRIACTCVVLTECSVALRCDV